MRLLSSVHRHAYRIVECRNIAFAAQLVMAVLHRYGHSEPESFFRCWNDNRDHRVAVLQTNGMLNAIRNCAVGLAAAAAVALPATMMPAPVQHVAWS